MAELVEHNLEGMLNELEQIQRVELLSPEEVKEVVKRRQRFEYKLQKRQKKKEDILAYIQYECALLQLIEMRRDKIKYLHKQSEIDFAIAKRINKLYKILEHRFGTSGDIKIWMSHLDFLVSMDWQEESSRVVRRLVQTQSHLPEAWVFAARFEVERKSGKREKLDNPDADFQKIENSRRLLLEGIRHHKDSKEIYREYFCLELHFIEKLQQEENQKREAEADEDVKEGKIAKIVLKQAIQDIPDDPRFEAELISLIHHFPIAKIRTNMIDFFVELRGEIPASWDALARIQLIDRITDDGRNVLDKINHCAEIYKRAIEKIPTSEMFGKYLTTMFELCPSVAKTEAENIFMATKILEAFELGQKFNILSANHQEVREKILGGSNVHCE